VTRLASSPVYLDAVLQPPRSLSPRGFDRLMLFVGSVSFVFGMVFILNGAYPVAGFMGLEVLLLWVLFHRSFEYQRSKTLVRVTAESVEVARIDPKGRARRLLIPTYHARILHDPNATGRAALRIAVSGKAYPIGDHLSVEDRESFALRLTGALADARRERHRSEQ
jgi:uncharacterized membrane protein